MSFQLANVTLRLGCVALWMILVLTMPHETRDLNLTKLWTDMSVAPSFGCSPHVTQL